jgi:hypothetical protein
MFRANSPQAHKSFVDMLSILMFLSNVGLALQVALK